MRRVIDLVHARTSPTETLVSSRSAIPHSRRIEAALEAAFAPNPTWRRSSRAVVAEWEEFFERHNIETR